MGFPRQEYWSGLPFPSPGDVPNPEIQLTSLTSPALAGGFFTTSATCEALPITWAAPMGTLLILELIAGSLDLQLQNHLK